MARLPDCQHLVVLIQQLVLPPVFLIRRNWADRWTFEAFNVGNDGSVVSIYFLVVTVPLTPSRFPLEGSQSLTALTLALVPTSMQLNG